MTLEDITIELQQPNIPPGKLSEYRLWLSAHYSYLAQKMESVLINKPAKWLHIRSQPGINSDTQADREWEMSEDGQIELKCKWEMKATEKLLSGISSRLRTMENEARNQY
jgi:hypothetical protein